MVYTDLVVLIPSHSLEDFPSELGEKEAASLLNAFAVIWHPALIAAAGTLPSWHRADEPPPLLENRLLVVPTVCEEWLPGGWADHARLQGATVVDHVSDRPEMVDAVLAGLDDPPALDPELVADFLALEVVICKWSC